jgi:hypothetical protein
VFRKVGESEATYEVKLDGDSEGYFRRSEQGNRRSNGLVLLRIFAYARSYTVRTRSLTLTHTLSHAHIRAHVHTKHVHTHRAMLAQLFPSSVKTICSERKAPPFDSIYQYEGALKK